MYQITVVKRDGSEAKLDLNQIQRVVDNACLGIEGVSALMVVLNAQIQFEDGIRTSNIQRVLINSAVDLITEEEPNYQFVAGRLVVQNLRKEVYGRWEPIAWKEHVHNMVARGVYESTLLTEFSDADFEALEEIINHDRDLNFTFGGIEQVQSKYLMRNRVTGECYETPQMVYMRIACSAYASLEGQARLDAIKDMYDRASTWDFSLPSPIMYSAGGPVRQGSSCVGIKVGDDLASIIEAGGAVVRYSAKRAGIGIDVGALRAEGYPIRGGEAKATGLIPYLKMFRGNLKSNAQGGVRGASATAYFPIFHPEVMNLLVLKNNKGTEESRERQLDYGLQINGYMMQRLLDGKDITLFCRYDDPELYEAFFLGGEEFARRYEAFEGGKGAKNKKVPAADVWKLFMGERFDVGRIYPIFVDNVNAQGPFEEDVIHHSNLCFSGDTLVAVADGRNAVPIKDLCDTEFLVYTGRKKQSNKVGIRGGGVLDGSFYKTVRRAKAFRTGVRELVEVTLSNGDKFKCTPDHMLALKGGGWVEASDALGKELEPFAPSFDRNPRFCGLTDEDIIAIACKFTAKEGSISEYGNDNMFWGLLPSKGGPSSFSIDRFGGRHKNLVDIGVQYEPPVRRTHQPQFSGAQDWRFVDVEGGNAYRGLVVVGLTELPPEEVFDITIIGETEYDNQNFYIITGAEDEDYLTSRGVLVHNCAEIALPSREFFDKEDLSGRVFLCTLGCLNWGKYSRPEEMRGACRTLVRYLDTFLSYQDYPQSQAREATLDYRPLGIGIINYAYFLAKNSAFYGDQRSLELTKLWMEHMAFYLTEASVDLAVERGACRRSADTCYGRGVFPWEKRKKGVNDLVSFEPTLPWEELRVKMKKYGIRNGTLMAFPPAETSSQPLGATNGIEPPQELISEKVSKDGVIKHVVPGLLEHRDFYVTKFRVGQDGCLNYLKCVAVMQAYVDQSISANTSYNPHDFPHGKVPFSKAVGDMFAFYRMGGKTLYYNLLYDGDAAANGTKKEPEVCESCTV